MFYTNIFYAALAVSGVLWDATKIIFCNEFQFMVEAYTGLTEDDDRVRYGTEKDSFDPGRQRGTVVPGLSPASWAEHGH